MQKNTRTNFDPRHLQRPRFFGSSGDAFFLRPKPIPLRPRFGWADTIFFAFLGGVAAGVVEPEDLPESARTNEFEFWRLEVFPFRTISFECCLLGAGRLSFVRDRLLLRFCLGGEVAFRDPRLPRDRDRVARRGDLELAFVAA